MNIYGNMADLIGKTPAVRLSAIENNYATAAKIIGKLEFFNPAGSVKDRIAAAMVNDGEKSGKLKEGNVIIEATSGNTGIGLAAVAARKGYKLKLVMPETMSVERRTLMAAYGAEIILSDGAKGMGGAVELAQNLAAETVNDSGENVAFMPLQFENQANPQIHFDTTGPEIWEQSGGKIDIFVAGVGTGGTISGAGKFLKSQNPNIEIVAVEPAGSPILSGGTKGPHKIQGIGAGFIPKILDQSIYNEVIRVENEEAVETRNNIARLEGLLLGISSGAALHAAILLASRKENAGKTVAVILPDTGERYLSTWI